MELINSESTGHLALLLEESSRSARLEERNRLAREIHDTVAQGLTGIIWQVYEAESSAKRDSEQLVASLARARDLAKQCLQETRRFIWDLRPAALEGGGLAEAVRQEVDRASESGVQASIELEGQQPGFMDKDCESAALRIAQEALSNVRHHAQAKSVMVTLTFNPKEVLLRITDDGIGFDPAAADSLPLAMDGGFGLAGMRERVRLVGGSLVLRSTPGMGATVEAHIPYQAESGSGITAYIEEASMALPVG